MLHFTFLNTLLLDKEYISIDTNLPVYITMTTIPSRMSNTIKLIKHFLAHVTGIEKFILNVPYQYNRWPEYKVSLSLDEITDPRFTLNRTEDYGPLTKLLGSINLIPNDSITVICDDMCYKLRAFKDIAEMQDKHRNKSFSFFVYPYKNNTGDKSVMVPQGADLISSYTQNLNNFPDWFNQFKQFHKVEHYYNNECFFVDDQVLGWYFQSHGIPMEQVDRRHRNIYIKNCDVSNKADNLNKQTGDRSRDNVMDKCYNALSAYYPI